MKVTEVTNAARKIIKEMDSMYIRYATEGSITSEQELLNLLSRYELSDDIAVKTQARHYKDKLSENLIVVLTQHD